MRLELLANSTAGEGVMMDKFRVFINGQFYYYGWIWIENVGISWVSPPTQGILSLLEVREKSEACTGSTDRNGVEIYAGDVVKYEHYLDDIKDEEFIEEIKFQDGSFTFKDLPLCEWFDENGNLELEIIGTIHANPELLEGKECTNTKM